MFFPEFLYQLSDRDQQITWLDPIAERLTTAIALATVNADFAVPVGKLLVLKSAVVEAIPGAAQALLRLRLSILAPATPAGLGTLVSASRSAGGVALVDFLEWSGDILVPPGWIVRGSGVFDAGAAANTVTSMLVGIIIPIGNVQQI